MVFEPYPTGGQQLKNLFQYVERFGFLDFILPAILIFVLIFGILQLVGMFKTKKMRKVVNPETHAVTWEAEPVAAGQPPVMIPDRKMNSIIAIAISLMITIPHAAGMYPENLDPIAMIAKILPSASVLLIAMFLVLLLLGFAGAEKSSLFQLVIAAVGVGLLVFIFATNIFPDLFPYFDFLKDPNIQALLIVLLTMGLVGYWVIRPEGPTMKERVKDWMTVRHPPARP